MLSSETIRQMRQTYEEWVKDSSVSARSLETMKWAYQQICNGEDPWTGLGSFSHAWYGYAKGKREALVTEPLIKPDEETENTHRWGAFCAASVEFLCTQYNIPCPTWIYNPYYNLKDPWYTRQTENSVLQEHIRQITPPPFTRRNVFCGNRIFQNKYEISEWIQEAIAQDITNPNEIHCYARRKEVSIHGG